MTILILEDSLRRWDWFRKHYSEKYDIAIVDNKDAAIKYLESNSPDIIFLDHDLDGKWWSGKSCENTGMEVAKYIAAQDIPFSKVIIHSMNIFKTFKMRRLCKKNTFVVRVDPLLTLRKNLYKEVL